MLVTCVVLEDCHKDEITFLSSAQYNYVHVCLIALYIRKKLQGSMLLASVITDDEYTQLGIIRSHNFESLLFTVSAVRYLNLTRLKYY